MATRQIIERPGGDDFAGYFPDYEKSTKTMQSTDYTDSSRQDMIRFFSIWSDPLD
jgi:hypothetical protein